MELRLYHPDVAYRDCNFCRAYLHDENGKVRLKDNKPVPRPNPQKVPCVIDQCPKGHYSKPLKATRITRAVIALYEQSQATFGHVLTDAERQDRLLAHLFAILDKINRQARQLELAQIVTALAGRPNG